MTTFTVTLSFLLLGLITISSANDNALYKQEAARQRKGHHHHVLVDDDNYKQEKQLKDGQRKKYFGKLVNDFAPRDAEEKEQLSEAEREDLVQYLVRLRLADRKYLVNHPAIVEAYLRLREPNNKQDDAERKYLYYYG